MSSPNNNNNNNNNNKNLTFLAKFKMAALTRLAAISLRQNQRLLHPSVIRCAGISTSKKNKDTVTVTDVITDHGKTNTEAEAADGTAKVSFCKGN